jgi:hypothetical protein
VTSQATQPLDLIGALKRQWWIVVLTALIAFGIAYASSTTVKPSYTASGVLHVGPAALSHALNAPTPDDMVRASSAEIRAAMVADGFTAAEVARVRFAAAGAPQTRISMTAEADDAATAEKLVNAAAKAALGYTAEATKVELARQADQIKAIESVLSAGKAQPQMSAFERWQMESALIDAKSGLETVQNVYTFDGKVNVATTSRLEGIRTTMAVALLFGGFVGLLLAGVREYLWRRKNAGASA